MGFSKFLGAIFSFLFLLSADKAFAAILENGKYRITSSIDGVSRLHIDKSNKNGGNLCIRKPADCLSQLFDIEKKDGYYGIKCEASNKMIDVSGASTKVGANIQQYTPNDTDAQNWVIIKWEDGTYSLISACNGLVMDVASGSNKEGTNVRCWELNGTKAQKFYFEKVQ